MLLLAALIVLPNIVRAEDQSIDPPAELMNRPAPVLSPEEALKSFVIEEGFEIQLVAAEPLVVDPVCMAWDEQGRLWVCEMRGYMPDQFGNGEDQPTGRIVILTDTDGDGTMDHPEVFLDEIVLPRAIAFAKNGILYADHESLYFVKINPDGSAGARMPFPGGREYSNNGPKKSNVEHQANGLLYGLDNWYYSAKSSKRFGFSGNRMRPGTTEFRGQWGITQDDDGRLLTNRNPVLIQYELFPPSATLRNDHFKFKSNDGIVQVKPNVYPIHPTPGTNRAYRPNQDVSHETWKLLRATAACGPVIYRGDQFPKDYYNNVFVPEPAGNLLKRIVLETDGQDKPTAKHAYENREFLASTDERNRFVNAYVGPDGCLYLVDMYRGLIQHKTYITEYLRRQINARGLDKPIGYGRIYRVVHKDSPVDHTPPKFAEMSSAELVKQLAHINSWRRETAQRLLVQRRDDDAVGPLSAMAMSHQNPQARIHALWTLQGMRKLSVNVLAAAGELDNERVRIQVLRLAESFEGESDAKRFVALMQKYDDNPSWEMDLQLAFSAGVLASIESPEAYDVLLGVIERRVKEIEEKDPKKWSKEQKKQASENTFFNHAVISGLKGKEPVMLSKLDSRGELYDALTGAMAKAVESGDLSMDAILALIDRPDFADKKIDLLTQLASQAIQQENENVILKLINRMEQPGAQIENQTAILQGMANGSQQIGSLVALDGKPELFERWMQNTPEPLAELVAELDNIFMFEKPVVDDVLAERLQQGRELFTAQCSACHNTDGSGLDQVAPPLVGSEWVDLHPKALAALVLNGLEGDIWVNGKLHTSPADNPGYMPGLKTSIPSDEDLANILTYIRSKDFKNKSGPVDPAVVAEMRAATANRTSLYSQDQLFAMSQQAFKAEGIEVDLPPPPPTPQVDIQNVGWLDHSERNLSITLIAVVVPLVLLLLVTIFGGVKPTA